MLGFPTWSSSEAVLFFGNSDMLGFQPLTSDLTNEMYFFPHGITHRQMVISRASNENFEPKAGLGPLAKFAGPEKGAHSVLLSVVRTISSRDLAL